VTRPGAVGTLLGALPLVLGLSACGPEQRSKRQQEVANISSDTAALEEASAAANAVIRNNMDCDTVNAAMPEANKRLEEAAGRIRTPAGRATLEALKNQVRAVAQNCPPGDVVRQQPPPP
jgi:uncharacterized lipoprotein